MNHLRSSQNYIWNTSSVLGKGATGSVFAGLHKQTGDSVAVKAFNHLSHMRPYEVQKREFEVLKKVNHQNIVKLLAIEEENETHHKVLIMELCTGGSLFNILDDPINYYGLEEREFLLVLKHLAAGMKHLRDMNIIHRDLKPGNIMKFLAEDQTSIYKLTDFGAARELEEDQQFMSLYGTEEYLHPDMYERAVLRKSVGKSFKANVDLWSIGVTLFHIATGVLPFRPFGGRKNKDTMYKITTGKASGIISGVQNSENGEIEWSRTLPKTCLISSSLQPLVTQLLAGLLECDENRMWSFDKFFKSVTNILSHKTVHIYYVNNLTDIVLYCHPNEKINDVKSRIETTIKLTINCQFLIWNKQMISDETLVTEFQTSVESPLLLLNSESTKIRATFPLNSTKFPDLVNTPTNCESDAQMAKLCASMGYSIQRTIEKSVRNHRLANATPSYIMSLIESKVNLLTEKQLASNHLLNSLENQLDYLAEMNCYLNRLISRLSIDVDFTVDEEPKQLFEKLKQDWIGLSPGMEEKVKNLKDIWAKESQNCSTNILSAQSKAKHYCNKIRESWQTLHKDKQSRALSLSYNEEQLHQLEKIKLDTNCKKLNDLLIKETNPAINIMAEKLEDWYSGAQVAIVQSDCLLNVISSSFMTDCHKLQESIKKVKEVHRKIWQQILNKINQNNETDGRQSIQRSTFQNLNFEADILARLPPRMAQELESLRESTRAVMSLIDENNAIMAEFESITIGSNN